MQTHNPGHVMQIRISYDKIVNKKVRDEQAKIS